MGSQMALPADVPEDGNESENLQMPDGTWVLADGRSFRLCGPEISSNPFLVQHVLDIGTASHTRQLLAGALVAGLQSGHRDAAAPAQPRALSLERHIYSLAGSYQTTRATPPTMRHVAQRFRAGGNDRVADHCLRVADEERGHDLLALKDLEALGIRSAALVAKVQPPQRRRAGGPVQETGRGRHAHFGAWLRLRARKMCSLSDT